MKPIPFAILCFFCVSTLPAWPFVVSKAGVVVGLWAYLSLAATFLVVCMCGVSALHNK